MKMTVKAHGFADLEKALTQIEKAATAKGVMRRALVKAAKPMADLAQSLAPDDPATANDDLEASITVGTRLSPRQRGRHRRMSRNDKASVEVFVGAGPLPYAHLQEFGASQHGPQPFMRPAFDVEARPTLDRLGDEMWDEIDRTAKRAAARAAKG